MTLTLPLLAIDVTGPGGGVALLLPGGIRTALLEEGAHRGRLLVPSIQRLLGEAGVGADQLGAVACAVGPGSFTGIRIGVATAATFAFAAGCPAIAVDSLAGIAWNAPPEASEICVALDARRGHVFGARFRREGERLAQEGDTSHLPAPLLAAQCTPATFLLGDARRAYPDLFTHFRGTTDAPVRPDAIAQLGAEAMARGEGIDPAQLRPLYLRLSDPELKAPRQEPGSA